MRLGYIRNGPLLPCSAMSAEQGCSLSLRIPSYQPAQVEWPLPQYKTNVSFDLQDSGDDLIEIEPTAGNTCSPLGDRRRVKRLLRSPGHSPPQSPRQLSPEPEPPFTTRCPVQSWHTASDSCFLARRHNQSRVEPVKTAKEWFSAHMRDRNLPCSPHTSRKRTASHFNIRLGSPYGAQTYRGPRSQKDLWGGKTYDPPSKTPRVNYIRKVGLAAKDSPRPHEVHWEEMRSYFEESAGLEKPRRSKNRSPSPGKQRLHSPDPIIVNDVHQPKGSFFSRSHQHWPDPVEYNIPDEVKEKDITGVPNSYFDPHYVSYWEQPTTKKGVKLQKRPAWYNNLYGHSKCLLRK